MSEEIAILDRLARHFSKGKERRSVRPPIEDLVVSIIRKVYLRHHQFVGRGRGGNHHIPLAGPLCPLCSLLPLPSTDSIPILAFLLEDLLAGLFSLSPGGRGRKKGVDSFPSIEGSWIHPILARYNVGKHSSCWAIVDFATFLLFFLWPFPSDLFLLLLLRTPKIHPSFIHHFLPSSPPQIAIGKEKRGEIHSFSSCSTGPKNSFPKEPSYYYYILWGQDWKYFVFEIQDIKKMTPPPKQKTIPGNIRIGGIITKK